MRISDWSSDVCSSDLGWLAGGASLSLEMPVLKGFNFSGGITMSPEFAALLAGLIIYTSAFVAEVVRSGIQSVNQGQWEAAEAIGLSRPRMLRPIGRASCRERVCPYV